jgi:hypothetical protein
MVLREALFTLFLVLPPINLLFASQVDGIFWAVWATGV